VKSREELTGQKEDGVNMLNALNMSLRHHIRSQQQTVVGNPNGGGSFRWGVVCSYRGVKRRKEVVGRRRAISFKKLGWKCGSSGKVAA
jgi:hypothetical protein